MDYKLYYWDLPFRGVFIEMLLQDVGASYQRLDASEIYPDKCLTIQNPGMAPPYLYDYGIRKTIAQMPAILMHLAHKYDYLPKRAETHTLALKTILDCNDVLMEITNYNGMQMWDKARWDAFRYGRLPEWMQIFENTGLAHGLHDGKGFLLGSTISVADIATTALFGTMMYAFPQLENDVQENAPAIAGLCRRIEFRSAIAPFLQQQRAEYGRGYCGGQIERSLRKVMDE
ncbi:glutathione S-transferase [Microbulbifer sp. CAU 1566]|uniref:glutathione S-transferase family protein n=1 Tax=Microbulbifer sp. CAU 1566 TaxID=2933269 RepID=UPI002002CD93|nr:glutathione S-transferase family protein [Microbulbifer sp. CAU 1566]MCK7596459.1 glutathione S-transferase [Microbulbifer sp. CAU 1566]